MKKKSKKNDKKRYTGSTMADRLPKNRGEWLEIVIKLTRRVIRDPPVDSQDYLRDQVIRLEKELNQWRKYES